MNHATGQSPVFLMESEKAPAAPWDSGKIMTMIQECQGAPDAVILASGGYYYPRGIYQLFETADGARIGIWAQDPDDMALGDFTVTEEWNKILCRNGVEEVPVGTTFKGAYLRDLGNGNLSRLKVFTVRPSYLADKWFLSETLRHNEAFLAFQMEQGRLICGNNGHWLANGIVYHLAGNRAFAKGRGGKPHDLIVTGASAPGWEMAHDYDRLFNTYRGAFMRAASVRIKGVGPEEARNIALDDFVCRLNHIYDGQSPYGFDFTQRQSSGFAPASRAWMRRHALHASYALGKQDARDNIKTVAALTIGNGSLFVGSWAVGLPVSPIVPLGKITGQAITRTGTKVFEFMRRQKRILNDDPIQDLMRHYTVGWDPSQVWGGRLNPMRVPFLRAIPEHRMLVDRNFARKTFIRLPGHHDGLANLYNPGEGFARGFMAGEDQCFRIDSPCGYAVEYFPGRKLRFAVRKDPHPLCRIPMRRSIDAVFTAAPKDKPYVMIRYDENTSLYKHDYLSQEEYKACFDEICRLSGPASMPVNDDPMPDFSTVEEVEKKFGRRLMDRLHRKLDDVFGDGAGTAITEGIEGMAEAVPDMLKPKL